ncbi:MAG: tetratricopeptide repeat protein [Vampirovibrionales bacterium]
MVLGSLAIVLLGMLWIHRHDLAVAYHQFNWEASILNAERQGRLHDAIQQATQATQAMPSHSAGFYQHLGRLYLKTGQSSQAIQALKHSFRQNPKQLAVGLSLGRLYVYTAQWSQASQHYQRMLKQFPASALLLMDLGDLYMKSGIMYRQHSQSQQSAWLWQWSQYYYEQAQKKGLPSSRILPRLGRVSYVQHQFPQAIQHYCKDLAQGSKHPLSRYYVGMSLLMLEFPDEGIYEAQSALHAMNDIGTSSTTTQQFALDLQATQRFLVEERPQEMLVPSTAPKTHHEDALNAVVPHVCLTPRRVSASSEE